MVRTMDLVAIVTAFLSFSHAFIVFYHKRQHEGTIMLYYSLY